MSHSWRSSRLSKYVALLVHFNTTRTLAAFALAVYLGFLVELFYFDHLPTALVVTIAAQVDAGTIRQSVLSEMVCTTVFLLPLFFGHLVGPAPLLFLDVASIQQDDAEQKAIGIEQLGATLDRTGEMICLIDENYWTRSERPPAPMLCGSAVAGSMTAMK